MTALFKRHNIKKILAGVKTQTRRIHKHTWKIGKAYALKDSWFSKGKAYIIITRKFRQKLGEITPEDVKKEGYNSLEEFKAEWMKLHGEWNPDQIVWVYEFKLADAKISKPSSVKEN
ncbi:MAG: ASCH domain-containing protein, partial [Candidatus Bathyarchaeia archaeon]